MAKPIAKLTGVFLRPKVSSNGRKYTAANIGKAVQHMNQRISSGGLPLTMNASHKSTLDGDVTKTGGFITKAWQDQNGAGHYEAKIVDTSTGRDIAALAIPDEDGDVGLKGVSIFGRWKSPVRTENGAETADDLEVTGVDFTHYPGVEGAGIDDAQVAEMAALGLFGESIEEVAFVETETAEIGITEDGLPLKPVPEASDPKKPYGKVTYADPGWQKDGKARYPLDTAAHVRAAWAYISMPKNQKAYSSTQVARIKTKIKSAAKKFDIDIASEMEAFEADILACLEDYASMCVYNGMGSVSVSGSTDDPQYLKALAQRVCLAAITGIDALDPDDDGDIDDDTAECASCLAPLSESAKFCPDCGHPVSEAAPLSNREEPIMATEYSTEQVKALLTTEQAETLDPKKESYTPEEVQALITPKPATESAPTAVEALVALLTGAKPEAPQEDELTKARRLVAEAEALESNKPVTAAQIAEMLKAEREEIVKAATESVHTSIRDDFRQSPVRKGLVVVKEDGGERPDAEELRTMPEDTFTNHLAATLVSNSVRP